MVKCGVSEELCIDLALLNGKIMTLDDKDTVAEAVAIKYGRIVRVGSNEDIKAMIGQESRVIDLNGKVAVPGFQDTHVHLAAFSPIYWYGIDLSTVKDIRGLLEKISQRVAETPKGKWIYCYKYDDERLAEKRHVTRQELDEVAPNNPVLIIKGFGHVYVVNSMALKLAGITEKTSDPVGGIIERDPETGELTGVLYENAYELIAAALPPVPLDILKESMIKSIKMFLRWGITTITEIEATKEIIQAYQELYEEKRLPIRVLLFVSANLMENLINLGIRAGFGNEWLKILGVKFYADGSGIGGTAAVYTPQHRGPKGLGVIVTPKDQLADFVTKCHNAGLRVAIHAIGDRGIDIALDAIEEAQRKKPNNLRHRIEHCSCCTPKQLERIKSLKVVPSSSIGYMWEFGDSYIENFGPERIRWIHPHKSYIEKGVIASGNSDWACSPADPMKQIYCAVTRKTKTGRTFCEDQAISVLEAVRTYTINAAYAGGEEDIKGTIEPGKLADIVVLSDDIFSIPCEKIKDVTVEMTIIGGKIVYTKGDSCENQHKNRDINC